MPFDGLVTRRETRKVARSKMTTRKLTEHELARVIRRLQRHEHPEVRQAVAFAIGSVVNQTLQGKHPINQLPTRVIWCVAGGARLLANDGASVDYAVASTLELLSKLPNLPKLPPKAAIRPVFAALLRRGPGRPKGAKTGTRGERTALIVTLLEACGLPPMTKDAVSKLLLRHATIDSGN